MHWNFSATQRWCWVSYPRTLMLPASRCTEFTLVLTQCTNHFPCLFLLLCCIFNVRCCSKRMQSLIHHRRFHHLATLNATYDNFSFDCRTINSCIPFRDPTHEFFLHCACLITLHVLVWINITLLFVVVVLLHIFSFSGVDTKNKLLLSHFFVWF